MARYRQLKPHVAVHGAPQHDKLFWLRSAVMSMLPWAVLLFALLAVLSRADIFLMLLLCMVLRVASGTARAKKGVRVIMLLRSSNDRGWGRWHATV